MSYEEYFETVKWYTLIKKKMNVDEEKRLEETMHRYEWCLKRQYEVGSPVCNTSRMLASVI